jgi:ATP adenylyltransferase
MKFLSAPWRWKFISEIGNKKECLFCSAPKSTQKNSLICYRGERFFVILNKYPYSTGHLMVVPYKHLASPDKISPADSTEMWALMNRSISILQNRFRPDGFNVGMNIGKSAGAGVKDHFHLHVVPRWSGDANFMSIIGETKVLSYSIDKVLEALKSEFKK